VDAAGAPLLLHNEVGRRRHWLTVRVLGTNGRSDAVGARVSITAGGRHQIAEVNPGGSFFAINDPRVHFGLGAATKVDRLEVRWPSGRVERRANVAADQFITAAPASRTPPTPPGSAPAAPAGSTGPPATPPSSHPPTGAT